MMHRSLWRGFNLCTFQGRGRKWNYKVKRGMQKFSENDMELIYQEYLMGGITHVQLAEKYGCGVSTISKLMLIMKARIEARNWRREQEV